MSSCSIIPSQTELFLPEWDHDTEMLVSATSNEDVSKVLEQWQANQDDEDLEIMEDHQALASSIPCDPSLVIGNVHHQETKESGIVAYLKKNLESSRAMASVPFFDSWHSDNSSDDGIVCDAVDDSRSGADGCIVRHAVAFCRTPSFQSFVASFGLKSGLSFEANPWLVGDDDDDGPSRFRQRHDGFLSACRGLPDTSKVAVVFHGTCKGNIPNILENGLDPNRRKGQAYGPGEYFSKNPIVPLSYCRGGNQMLVFLVVVPVTKSGTDSGGKIYFRKPDEYVVVETNAHQLPLGVLSFGEVDRRALQSSKQLMNKCKSLSAKLEIRNESLRRAKVKVDFIQILIRINKFTYFEQMQKASQIYLKNKSIWSHAELREISMYAHKTGIDAEMITYYFPDLPDPMTGRERDECSEIYSVEDTEREVQRIQRKIAKRKRPQQWNHHKDRSHSSLYSYSDRSWDAKSFVWQQYVTGLATPNQK